MRRICRIVIITLAYVAGLAGPTMASAFSCPVGSFLSSVGTPNTDLSGFTGPYGDVCVTLTDSTHALVQAETFSPFLMGGNGTLGLQVNSTAFDVVGGTAGITGSPNVIGYTVAFPGGQEDGFGKFDLTIDSFDGYGDATTFLTFSLVNNAATWTSVSDVLTGNASNYDAAMKIFVDGCGREACGGGFAAESDARIVAQVPEPGILSLLGMGLLAMGLPALRRRLA